MLTRSSGVASSSSTCSTRHSYDSRKSLPSILTRSRKRKSDVLQEEDKHILSRLPIPVERRSRLSLSNDFNFSKMCLPPQEISEGDERRPSRRRSSRHSTPSDVGSNTCRERDYRRRLLEDYDTRSTTSSSASSVISSTTSSSYYTRRSSRRSHSDQESVISSLSERSESEKSAVNGIKDSRISMSEAGENSPRACHLPNVCFADCQEVWEYMIKMDKKYSKVLDCWKGHHILNSQMRRILIDWMMDVCEAYHQHRETFYLAVDYLDRYLIAQKNVMKNTLQLLGITCLFIASKLEEIYPPKLSTFAYVTDGACEESEILDMELVVMKTLKWKLTPITPASWVSIYLQVLSYRNVEWSKRSGTEFFRNTLKWNRNTPEDSKLVRHIYKPVEYVKAVRMIDLTILDVQTLNYSYSTLAAAAIYHTQGRQAALLVSGMKWAQLGACVNYMAPIAAVLRRNEIPPVLPSIANVQDEYRHLIQSHCVSLDMLEQAERLRTSKICSPVNHAEGLVTPPSSGEKSFRQKH